MNTDRKVCAESVPVLQRLYDLGIGIEVLRKAVEYGMGHASECTAHDPPSLRGILAWGKTVRSLRDQLIPQGWSLDNARNYPTVIHPNRSFAIAVAGGDAATGIQDKTPATRSEKGPVTRAAVAVNQLSFGEIEESFRRLERVPAKLTWLLLHFFDEKLEEIRMELALPAHMTEDGYVTDWRERLILPAIVLNPTPSLGSNDTEGEDIDVKVERRSSSAGGQSF